MVSVSNGALVRSTRMNVNTILFDSARVLYNPAVSHMFYYFTRYSLFNTRAVIEVHDRIEISKVANNVTIVDILNNARLKLLILRGFVIPICDVFSSRGNFK